MDSKVGLDGNCPFTSIANSPDNQQVINQGCTVSSVASAASSSSQRVSDYQQTPIRLRRHSSLAHCRSHIFKGIKDIVLQKAGTIIDINQESIVFNVTKEFCEYQDNYFKTCQYHDLIEKLLEGTDIPSLIKAERLIPIVLAGDRNNQLILEFKDAPEAYAHTLDGQEIALETKFITPLYNPQALSDLDTSMLRVNMGELGFTDGSPRYIFTTGLGPCICVTLFDKYQNKVLLGHFTTFDFTPESLSEIFKFCDDQQMKGLECHIVGGTYEYLGIENGFLSLMNFLSSKGVPIKQMFVGDTTDRPIAVVVDTKDMTLYGLPFNTLNNPNNREEEYESKNKLKRISNMPLLTKSYTLSLLTCSLDA
ncbi:hypothetical protein M3P05_20355 [Sansalvadorimonas sp. 2012CJ34-2]|uniref:Uncharacterized protein n=1 Tax=Parendozoicomonas callyspongiae TaxID=2942213 RepID=A0ABT0PLL8_9GAMM|nr:hypothetical protein [Sansalvadorimonas sp. 2012CJ34-2]MCL6272274.1 hypothetical protein [Sansalvadorimonas sp. 2012CJ34-2]